MSMPCSQIWSDFMFTLLCLHLAKVCLELLHNILNKNNLRVSKCVFPLFNTESYTFQIKNNNCAQRPFEIVSRED